jgi:hypothetical protein
VDLPNDLCHAPVNDVNIYFMDLLLQQLLNSTLLDVRFDICVNLNPTSPFRMDCSKFFSFLLCGSLLIFGNEGYVELIPLLTRNRFHSAELSPALACASLALVLILRLIVRWR